jgi:asparagine synthase (glutamine-hydrolysing)
MWAVVLCDLRQRRLVVSRDRLGIKPLYSMRQGGSLAFCSEVKQLTALGRVLRVRRDALEAWLATGYEDQRRTLFCDVAPLAPGTFEVFSLDDGRKLEGGGYWAPERINAECDDPDEAATALQRVLRTSVREHLRSDVPVGCALSGGLDSSSVAALIHDIQPGGELNTFTATFPGEAIDERHWVDRVLTVVRARPHYVTPTAEGFLREVDRWLWMLDEPPGSLSQYAGWCVARLTREAGVPVTLNGQGGDEVLGGYWQSYFTYLRGAARAGRLLEAARHGLGSLSGNPELLRQVPVMLRRYLARRAAGTATDASTFLDRILSMSEQERRVFEIREMFLPRLLKWDDRNFMSFSVEGRYPFLDHECIELGLKFSPKALYSRGWVKEPLRRAMVGLLPESVLRRRSKLGFETPQQSWVRGPLRDEVLSAVEADGPLWRHTDRKAAAVVVQGAMHLGGEERLQHAFRIFLAARWMKVFELE